MRIDLSRDELELLELALLDYKISEETEEGNDYDSDETPFDWYKDVDPLYRRLMDARLSLPKVNS